MELHYRSVLPDGCSDAAIEGTLEGCDDDDGISFGMEDGVALGGAVTVRAGLVDGLSDHMSLGVLLG